MTMSLLTLGLFIGHGGPLVESPVLHPSIHFPSFALYAVL